MSLSGEVVAPQRGRDLPVDEVPDEPDHGPLVLVQLVDAQFVWHGSHLRSVSAAFSQVHLAGSVSRPATQSASLAASWSGVGGRAGDPGGYCWRVRSTAPSAVCTSASSSPSSRQSPPGASLV